MDTLYLPIFGFAIIMFFVLAYPTRKKRSESEEEYVPGDDLFQWSIPQVSLFRNLNQYRTLKYLDVFEPDRSIHDFANYCARLKASTPDVNIVELQEIYDTAESLSFSNYSFLFEDVEVLSDTTSVGKSLKCSAVYRKFLLDKKYKYIGIGVELSANGRYYYCVIIAD